VYIALWAIFSAQLWVDIAKGGEQNFSPGTSVRVDLVEVARKAPFLGPCLFWLEPKLVRLQSGTKFAKGSQCVVQKALAMSAGGGRVVSF
jgi:hypothetical protein